MQSEPCTETKLRSPLSPALHLLANQAVTDLIQPRTAVPLEVAAQEPHRPDLRHQLGRKAMRIKSIPDDRQDPLIDEPPDLILDLPLPHR